MGDHYEGENLVTPTPGFQPTPSFELGVELDLPAMAHPGEAFYVTGRLINTIEPISRVNVCFVLGAFDRYYFWPGWIAYQPGGEIDFRAQPLRVGIEEISVVEPFIWPETGEGAAIDLYFYGAMLSEDFTAVIGEMASVNWGYGP